MFRSHRRHLFRDTNPRRVSLYYRKRRFGGPIRWLPDRLNSRNDQEKRESMKDFQIMLRMNR